MSASGWETRAAVIGAHCVPPGTHRLPALNLYCKACRKVNAYEIKQSLRFAFPCKARLKSSAHHSCTELASCNTALKMIFPPPSFLCGISVSYHISLQITICSQKWETRLSEHILLPLLFPLLPPLSSLVNKFQNEFQPILLPTGGQDESWPAMTALPNRKFFTGMSAAAALWLAVCSTPHIQPSCKSAMKCNTQCTSPA